MKKKILSIILITIGICNSFAQDYLQYFKVVAAAEILILDKEYKNALIKYDSIFSCYSFIFPKDALIAAQLASYSKEDEYCYKFLTKGIACGLSYEILKHNPHITRWFNNGNIITQNEIDSLKEINEARINKTLRDTIVSMIKLDQKLRDKNETRLNSDIFNHKLKPRLFKKWKKQAKNQSETILEFTKKFGFPSHKTIGTNQSELLKKFGTNYSSTYATIILFHHDFAWTLFREELPNQLKKGNITPKQFALIRDFETRHFMFGEQKDTSYANYKYFIRWRSNTLNSKNNLSVLRCLAWAELNKETIDKSRIAIGLVPYDYSLKKKSIQWEYDRFQKLIETMYLPYFDFNYWGWD